MTVYLTVFDVEHGSCALLTAANGTRMLIDCGQNVSTGWSPAKHLSALGTRYLEMLAVTNYDEDHVDGLPELRRDVEIGWLLRSKNVEPYEIAELKSEDGMGAGINSFVEMAQSYTGTQPPPNFEGVDWSMYWNDRLFFADENNLSGVIKLSIYGVGVLFTGDMEKAGFDALLERTEFRAAISDVGLLIAPHHGRFSAVHEGFLTLVSPYWTVISDKGYMHTTQETVPIYAKHTRGASFRGNERRVLTTRSDGAMTFGFTPTGWDAY